MPLLSQFSKISNDYQTVISRINALEIKSNDLEKKNKDLLQENVELQKAVKDLTVKLEAKEADNSKVAVSQVGSIVHANDDRLSNLEKNYGKIQAEIATTKSLINQSCAQVEFFSGEIEKIKREQFSPQKFTGSELMPYNGSDPMDYIRQVEEKTLEVERTLNILSVHHSELELQLQASLASTHNGAFLWRIPDMKRRIRDAKIGRITSIYSPPFYTGRNGYKMCIRAYLNGDGSGEGTHLSIFFVLMKGEYDPLLQWPFDNKVSLVLVDQNQKKHLVQTFKPNLQSSSFQRPKSDMNVASGCPEFAKLSVLDDPSYVKDDVMYIKAIVDTSKIIHP